LSWEKDTIIDWSQDWDEPIKKEENSISFVTSTIDDMDEIYDFLVGISIDSLSLIGKGSLELLIHETNKFLKKWDNSFLFSFKEYSGFEILEFMASPTLQHMLRESIQKSFPKINFENKKIIKE